MLDLYRGRLSWRRLRVLITHLPPESATMTALRNANPDGFGKGDPAEGRWSQAEMLLASVADEVRLLRHDYGSAHAESRSKRPKAPQPIPRPGVKPPKPKLNAAQADFLFRHINGLPQPEHVQITVRPGKGAGGGG